MKKLTLLFYIFLIGFGYSNAQEKSELKYELEELNLDSDQDANCSILKVYIFDYENKPVKDAKIILNGKKQNTYNISSKGFAEIQTELGLLSLEILAQPKDKSLDAYSAAIHGLALSKGKSYKLKIQVLSLVSDIEQYKRKDYSKIAPDSLRLLELEFAITIMDSTINSLELKMQDLKTSKSQHESQLAQWKAIQAKYAENLARKNALRARKHAKRL